MGFLTSLALATPIFGFALTPPASLDAMALPASLDGVVVAQLEDTAPAAEADETPSEADQYTANIRKRAKLAKLHRTLGIVTFAAMTWTVASGTVQFRNLYGGWDDLADTPCVTGDAWPSQRGCSRTPVSHLVSGVVTASLYVTTMGISFAMPDPNDAATGDSKFARRLRTHKALRWVHMVGMLAQMVLGPLVANPQWMGMDRATNYDTLKALSTVHMAIGYTTYGAMTAAGTIMLF